MAVQLQISYETLVELVDQLPQEQQHTLLLYLLDKAKTRPLTNNAQISHFREHLVRILSASEAFQTMLASEHVLSRDWDTPEEDAAWANL